jgi:ABC-type polar amino acid transport system ATPase subunit
MKLIIEVANLKKSYGSLKVLNGISFGIKKGEIKCIIGPSGSGKTTLLRCLSLLENFDEGKIIYHGNNKITSLSQENEKAVARKRIGIVFQDFNLWPHKSVVENVVEPLILVGGLNKHEATEKALEMLKKVGLEDKKDDHPDFLSGGQKQRVAIARTLAMNPEIILFDEITSSLDPELVSGILKLLKRLALEGQTMIIVTHHLEFASEVADDILFMDEGIVIEESPPEKIFRNPKDHKTKNFLKTLRRYFQEINIYEGTEDFRAFNIGFMRKIKPGGEYYVLGAAKEDWWKCMGEAQHEWHRIRARKNIKLKMILYELVESEKRILEKMPKLTEYRLIPKNTEVPSNVNIYDDTILLLIFDKKRPTVIEIRNKDLVKGYLNYFNILWGQGKQIVV